jgi:hypothetical protein
MAQRQITTVHFCQQAAHAQLISDAFSGIEGAGTPVPVQRSPYRPWLEPCEKNDDGIAILRAWPVQIRRASLTVTSSE